MLEYRIASPTWQAKKKKKKTKNSSIVRERQPWMVQPQRIICCLLPVKLFLVTMELMGKILIQVVNLLSKIGFLQSW